MGTRCRSAECSGFTLLEVMVAVSILGISLVVIMQLFSMGLKSSSINRDYSLALMLARAKMGEVLIQKEIEEGTDSDTFDIEDEFDTDYRWYLDIKPYCRPISEEEQSHLDLQPGLNPEDELPFKMYELSLQVRWNSGGSSSKNVTLTSLKLVYEDDDESAGFSASPQAKPAQVER